MTGSGPIVDLMRPNQLGPIWPWAESARSCWAEFGPMGRIRPDIIIVLHSKHIPTHQPHTKIYHLSTRDNTALNHQRKDFLCIRDHETTWSDVKQPWSRLGKRSRSFTDTVHPTTTASTRTLPPPSGHSRPPRTVQRVTPHFEEHRTTRLATACVLQSEEFADCSRILQGQRNTLE